MNPDHRQHISLFLILGLISVILSPPAFAFFGQDKDSNEEMICLTSCGNIPELLADYMIDKPIHSERDEIEYLLYRIRSSDKNIFIRNGDSYDSKQAERFLRWKFLWWMKKFHERIETDEDFVNKVLSGSKKTGKPYYLKMPNGKVYNAQKIMRNELNLMNLHIKAHSRPA